MLKLPGRRQVNIIETIAYRWQDATLTLHFQGSVIKIIQQSVFNNVEGCRRMLGKWLEGGCHEPVTWERLVEVLQYAGFVDLADKLKVLG